MPTIPRSQTPDPRRRKTSEARDRPQDKRYWSPTWRKARLAYHGHHPTCVECGRPAKVLDHITRLSESQIAALFRFDGAVITCAASHGTTPAFAKQLQSLRAAPSPATARWPRAGTRSPWTRAAPT